MQYLPDEICSFIPLPIFALSLKRKRWVTKKIKQKKFSCYSLSTFSLFWGKQFERSNKDDNNILEFEPKMVIKNKIKKFTL